MIRLTLLTIATASLVAGCGGGGGGSPADGGGAGLALRVQWTDGASAPAGAAAAGGGTAAADGRSAAVADAEGPGAGGEPVAPADFAPALPPSVVQGRILVRGQDSSCCMAFDPRAAVLGGARKFVLTGLQAGPVGVQISGFATRPVPQGPTGRCRPTDGTPLPEPSESFTTCSALPAGLAVPCAPESCAVPSFDSGPDAATVTLVDGQERDAGDVATPRLPFLLDPSPPCDGAVPQDGVLGVKVVEAFAAGETQPVLTPADVAVSATQIDRVAGRHACPAALPPEPFSAPLALTPCSDRSAVPGVPSCSDAAALDVGGAIATGDVRALELEDGCVEVKVAVKGHEPLCYDVLVGASGPTPTPTTSPGASATPTASPTPAGPPTPTGAPTASPAPSSNPTPTGGATATPSPSRTPAPSGASSPTPTQGQRPTPITSATPGPTRTPRPTATPAPSAPSGGHVVPIPPIFRPHSGIRSLP